MYLIIILLPLISSFSSGFLGFYLGRQGALFLACFFLALACVISFLIFYEVVLGGSNVSLTL